MANQRVCSIPECGKRHFGHGYCNAHYSRWRKHGDATAGEPTPGWARNYFENSVVPFTGKECLIWPFAKSPNGYGKLGIDGKSPDVHRLACERVHGAPPTPKHEAAHNCGNGHLGCCNPNHLEWKTHVKNMADRVIHGTHTRGEQNPRSKLNTSQVLEIRSLHGQMTEAQIAAKFGVSRGCISGILGRHKWGWLNGPADLDAA